MRDASSERPQPHLMGVLAGYVAPALASLVGLACLGTAALAAQRPADLKTNPNYPRVAVELIMGTEKMDSLVDGCAKQLKTLKEGPECQLFVSEIPFYASLRDSHAPEVDRICAPAAACRKTQPFAYLDELTASVQAKIEKVMTTLLAYSYGITPPADE